MGWRRTPMLMLMLLAWLGCAGAGCQSGFRVAGEGEPFVSYERLAEELKGMEEPVAVRHARFPQPFCYTLNGINLGVGAEKVAARLKRAGCTQVRLYSDFKMMTETSDEIVEEFAKAGVAVKQFWVPSAFSPPYDLMALPK